MTRFAIVLISYATKGEQKVMPPIKFTVYTEKNGFATATKLGTTNKIFVAATKNFAAPTKRFVDRTKHCVVVTKYFCYSCFNK